MTKQIILALMLVLSFSMKDLYAASRKATTKSNMSKSSEESSYFFEPLSLGLGVGNYSEFIGDVQVNTDASTNKFDFVPYLNTNIEFRLYKDFSWRPELAMTLPKSEESDAISTTVYMIRSDFVYTLSAFKFLIGPGYFITKISGDGGTLPLQNGSSGTQTFFLPSQTVYATNYTLDIGVEGRISPDFSSTPAWKKKSKNYKKKISNSLGIKAQAHIFALLNTQKRQWAYTLSINYYFNSKGGWDFF